MAGVNLIIRGTLIFLDDRLEISNTIEVESTATIDFNGFLINTDTVNLIISNDATFIDAFVDPVTNIPTSGFTSVVVNQPPLPITLNYTNIQQVGNVVFLTWSSLTEQNNYGFTIQRRNISTAEIDWMEVGFKYGVGTTIHPQTYLFTDELPPYDAMWEYRLQQMDFDGRTVLYGMGYANSTFSLEKPIIVYPNPSNGMVIFRFLNLYQLKNCEIQITDLLGKTVYQKVVNLDNTITSHTFTMDSTYLSTGIYFFLVHFQGYSYSTSFVNIK